MKSILILGGISENSDPNPFGEVLNLDLTNTCNEIAIKEVSAINGAIGGLINEKPFICGGYIPSLGSYSRSCYKLNENSFILDSTLEFNKGIGFSGYAQYKDKLLITGGVSGSLQDEEMLNGIHVLTSDGFQVIGDLNYEIKDHCMVQIDENTFMLTGGKTIGGELSDEYLHKTTVLKLSESKYYMIFCEGEII